MARGSNIGNPAGYMGDFARRGLSANKALKAFREAGGSMGNQAFRQGYASVRQSIAENPTVHSLPGGEVPGMEHFSPWQAGRPGRYAYNVDIHVYDRDIDGIIVREWTQMSDVPLTIDEATQLALDDFDEYGQDSDRYAGQRSTGATIRSLNITV